MQIVFPVHLNPNVREPVFSALQDKPNIKLIDPLTIGSFIWLLQRCFFALTDSGGVQEEAPSFGKPVLVMRDHTERPEGIAIGWARLVGTHAADILRESLTLLHDRQRYLLMSRTTNPYGDGNAASRIISDLLQVSVSR